MRHFIHQIIRTGTGTVTVTVTVTEPTPRVADANDAAVQRIHQDIFDILGQALTIREVDAGSCNGCEPEISALMKKRIGSSGVYHSGKSLFGTIRNSEPSDD